MAVRLTAALVAMACGCAGPGALSRSQNSELPMGRYASSDSGNSSQSQSSEGNSSASESSASSGDSSAAGGSSASAESTNGQSTGDGIGNTLNSRYPSSVQTSDASRPSSEQSSQSSAESTASSENSSENSTEQSSQTQTQINLAPVFSTAGLTTTAGAVGLIIWLATRPKPEAAEAAVTFLRANQFQLQEDLALGAGRSLDDLSALARIRPQNKARFVALLVAHRRELLELADARLLTPERAVRALRRIGELAQLDPLLREDGARAVAELGR